MIFKGVGIVFFPVCRQAGDIQPPIFIYRSG
jgi:hypothetical protein